jgi:hypothetical protein
MKRVFLLVLLITIVIKAYPQNLVVNPGFESWSQSTKPSGWTTTQNCLKDSSFIRSGSYSCRHTGGTSTKYLGQSINVIPGKQYSLSFYFKTDITGTGNGCRLWCYWKDSGGNNINDPGSDDIIRPSAYLKNENWQCFAINIIAPTAASAFYLEVRTYPNSVTYWDDIVFAESIATNTSRKIESEINIYPNPAHKYLLISNLHNIQRIDIQGITGSIIWSEKFSGESEIAIPLTEFKNGIYLVRIYTHEGQMIRKFIKN